MGLKGSALGKPSCLVEACLLASVVYLETKQILPRRCKTSVRVRHLKGNQLQLCLLLLHLVSTYGWERHTHTRQKYCIHLQCVLQRFSAYPENHDYFQSSVYLSSWTHIRKSRAGEEFSETYTNVLFLGAYPTCFQVFACACERLRPWC